MKLATNLTRMWLTRSLKPFTFQNEYDQELPFPECRDLGQYVHIPFCKSICDFCPYCKVPYSQDLCNQYIDALIREIHLVGGQNSGKKNVTSLYFGGGTPALAAGRLGEILEAVREHFTITQGIGVDLAECRRDENQHWNSILPGKIPAGTGTPSSGRGCPEASPGGSAL